MADKPTPGHPHSSTAFDKSPSSAAAWQAGANQPDAPSFTAPLTYAHLPTPLTSTSVNLRSMESHKTSAAPALLPMGPPPLPAASLKARKLDISSLMSPPDALLDSFAPSTIKKTDASALTGQGDDGAARPLQSQPLRLSPPQQPLPMSPPISPYNKPATGAVAAPAVSSVAMSPQVTDPVLYPTDDASPAGPSQPPLFAPAELEHQRIVDQHMRARSQNIFADIVPPRREDYELALTFRCQVMKHYTANRKKWLRKERAFLEADRRAGARRYHAIMPAKPVVASKVSRPQRAAKGQATNSRQMRTHHHAAAAVPAAVPAKPAAARVSATPEPASRRMVAPNREDKDFDALPNYCPPASSLPHRPNSLKVDWKGQPIDLSNDHNVHLLHPDEVMLAGNLRLDCATYLTSKRRIFERRLQCLRTGKEFRKTDAQQACKIDVNKASKLWTAFEKVGWLDAEWVRKYL
ncbi:hypothetical protein CDD80_7475 [Ophiocordyceps camponoti-rufipedis]|uniref:SWIRM domain-containing protein n=1 Tax=Ophiocordyceps camponoti-rufipedis TaxID=2004952 RepID=A0A2C5ZDS0_9HYPO|nr:hypothetical protein CDD80_7475 [Ophiocordyceps camponoti-rufipedis]